MSNVPNDDLFEGTKMTFGEHLEELRVSLYYSMIGLVIGTMLALVIAKDIVKAIQEPLKNALESYYLTKATDELVEKFGKDKVPPEILAMVAEQGLVPDYARFEAAGFLAALRAADPVQFGSIQFKPHRFIAADLVLDNAAELAQYHADGSLDETFDDGDEVSTLCARLKNQGKSDQVSPGKLLWALMSTDQRRSVERISEKDDINAEDRATVVAILNVLIERPEIPTSDEFSQVDGRGQVIIQRYNPIAWLNRIFAGPDKLQQSAVATVKKLREQAADAERNGTSVNDDELRRLNKLLIAAAFPDVIRRPQLMVIEMPTWKPTKIRVQTLNAQEAFMIWLKAALITGVVVTSPWIFWHIWQFVGAGLYPHEKRYVHIYLPFSLGLFFAGTALAFFFVFEPVLNFLFSFNKLLEIDPDPRISEWLSFVLFLPLGFGIAFQLPIVMLFLNRIGVLDVKTYLEKWRIAILVIFVISMLLTPADPISMLLMAMPLTGLYFMGIALCKWMPKGRNPFDDAYEP